jgi:hypothetical protein
MRRFLPWSSTLFIAMKVLGSSIRPHAQLHQRVGFQNTLSHNCLADPEMAVSNASITGLNAQSRHHLPHRAQHSGNYWSLT